MEKKQFFTAVLSKLGLPISENNIKFLILWSNFEQRAKGRPHGFNPLNTTFNNIKNDSAQTNFNTNAGFPVKNYSTFQSGVDSTANTLKLRYYKNIIYVLKLSLPIDLAYQQQGVFTNLRTWGTHQFAKKFITPVAPIKKESAPIKGTNIILPLLLLLGIYVIYTNY